MSSFKRYLMAAVVTLLIGGVLPISKAVHQDCTNLSTSGRVSVCVDETTITPGQTVRIWYQVNQTLYNGLGAEIRNRNSGGFEQTLEDPNFGIVNPGLYSQTWNALYYNNADFSPGQYDVVFYEAVGGTRISGATAVVEVIAHGGSGSGVGTVDVTNSHASPSPFDPDRETTNIWFTLNRGATVDISITQRDAYQTVIARLSQSYSSGGTYSLPWNGRDDYTGNIPCASGNTCTYDYRITATTTSNGGDNSEIGPVQIRRTGVTPPPPPPPPPGVMNIYGTSVGNFNPEVSPYQTTIYFSLNQYPADITATISRNSGGFSTTLTQNISCTSCTLTWNGRDSSGNLAPAGIYTASLSARNYIYGTDTDSAQFEVIRTTPPVGAFIVSHNASPTSFSRTSPGTRISYTVGKTVYSFNVAIQGTGSLNSYYRSLTNVSTKSVTTPISEYVDWNGYIYDGQGNYVLAPVGYYDYVLSAANESSVSGSIQVTEGISPPRPGIMNIYGTSVGNFNPEVSPYQTTIYFSLNQYPADITATISRNSGGFSTTLTQNISCTSCTLTWNGRDSSGNLAPAGIYTASLSARNYIYGTDTDSAQFEVVRSTPPSGDVDIYGLFSDPSSFDPEDSPYETRFTFSLNRDANVTTTITRNEGGFSMTLSPASRFFNSGTGRRVTWNGRDTNGYIVSEGWYTARLDATSSGYSPDSATTQVYVDRDGGGGDGTLEISDYGPRPNPFDPRDGESTNIEYSVNMTPTSHNVRIYRYNSTSLVRELSPTAPASYEGRSYRATWNGRDRDGDYVAYGLYTYRITVYANSQIRERTGRIDVREDGRRDDDCEDYYDDDYCDDDRPVRERCANFRDVRRSNSICAAVEFAKSRGIFKGYDDGTIGLNKVIKRSEMLAVLQKAFRYPLEEYDREDDGDLGFTDLRGKSRAWYMSLIKTFVDNGIIRGYPDHTFKPERTINTAEFFVLFLRAAKNAPDNIDHFTIDDEVRYKPFDDTPLNTANRWYLKYAQVAKLYDLIDGDRFYPSRGITRGQVIKIIYDTYRDGMITYGPARESLDR